MANKVLCTICARGGSKGVPGKNSRLIAGKPLIAHTIEQARNAGIFHTIAVSSDCATIRDIASRFGADLVIERPSRMATDAAGKTEAIKHAASHVEAQTDVSFDYFFDLDATSPLRVEEDILACLSLITKPGCDTVVTGSPARRSPYFNLVEAKKDGRIDIVCSGKHVLLRRQDAPPCYDMNASIYVWTRESFLAGPSIFTPGTRIYEMPEERSIDIDTELDWDIVEFLMNRKAEVL